MDAISTGRDDLSYCDQPPVLVAGSGEAAIARGLRTVESCGVRVGEKISIDAAQERIERQAATSAVWIELDSDGGATMDGLLARVNRDVADGRYAAVVSASTALVDPVIAQLGDSHVELIVDASDTERTAALAIAMSHAVQPRRLSDIAADQNAARLRQLSEEVSRIATTLARLSAGPQVGRRPIEPLPPGDAPEVSADTVRSIIRARRLRAR
jgi:hypothetical protein